MISKPENPAITFTFTFDQDAYSSHQLLGSSSPDREDSKSGSSSWGAVQDGIKATLHSKTVLPCSIFKGQRKLYFVSFLLLYILEECFTCIFLSLHANIWLFSLKCLCNIYRNKMLNANTDWFFLSHQMCLHSKCTQISHFTFKNMNMLCFFFLLKHNEWA